MSKTARYYRGLPYRRVAERVIDSDGAVYFVAKVVEIPSIRIDGDSPEEAFLKLDEVFDDFIEAMLDAGDEIPEPERFPNWTEAVQGTVVPAGKAPKSSINVDAVMPQPTRPWDVRQQDGALLTV